MLRLFEDCVDLSEPDSEGWTIVGDLVSSFNQEGSSVHSNSIIWFLTALKTDSMVGFGPKTLWHGLQHAIRSFMDIAEKNKVVQSRLDLMVGGGFPPSHAMAIAFWIALLSTSGELLPMILAGGSVWHMEGFDFDQDSEVDPVQLAKQRPEIHTTWSKILKASLERADKIFNSELDALIEASRWSHELFQELKSPRHNVRDQFEESLCCSECNDDYTRLKLGLVEPRRIAFAECTKLQHRSHCACREFLGSQEQLPYSLYDSLDDDSSDGEHFHDAESQHGSEAEIGLDEESWRLECDRYIREEECAGRNDPFKDVATLLYRCQARLWLATYEPRQRLCGTCFLRSEGYTNNDVPDNSAFWSSMPMSFSNKEL